MVAVVKHVCVDDYLSQTISQTRLLIILPFLCHLHVIPMEYGTMVKCSYLEIDWVAMVIYIIITP